MLKRNSTSTLLIYLPVQIGDGLSTAIKDGKVFVVKKVRGYERIERMGSSLPETMDALLLEVVTAGSCCGGRSLQS